jgi:hypothetical protein
LNALFGAIDDPQASELWRTIAMNGAALLAQWDRRKAGIFIALAATVGRGVDPNPGEVAAMLRVGRDLASRHQAEDPVSYFHPTVEVLKAKGLETITDDVVSAVLAEFDDT